MNDHDNEAITQIADVIQSALAVNGQLAFPFYKQFWANIHESPECAACYLAVLLSKLVGITSGEDKYTPLPDLVTKIVSDSYTISASDVQKLAPDADPVLMALRQSILLTLYFIGIHVRFAVVHPSMNLAFAKWIEFNAIQRWISAKNPFVDEVISILTASFDNNESLVQFIDNATTVDVPMDLCQDLGDARVLSRALLSAWLVRGSSFPLPKLISAVLDVLKKENLPESRVLVSLHLLKKLIIHTPYISHATIYNALSLLKPYYLWPRPYGDHAREVMEILSSEARNPGHILRSMILHEFPGVLTDHPKMKYARPAAHGRVIHLLVDTLHNDGSIMHDLLKSSPADDPSPAQLQIDLLGNILYRVLGIEADILGVEHCPHDLLSELLAEALNVMDYAATLPEKDASAFRLQHIKAIRDRVMDSAAFDSYGYPPRHPTPPPFHMSIVQLKCSNTRPRRSEDLTDSQLRIPLRKNSVQALAQIFASYQHQNRSQQPNGTQSPPLNRLSQKHSPSPPNFAVPVHDPNSKANQKSVNANQQQQPQQPSTPPQPRLVRIAIIGSDSALHNVVTGYVTLRREQPLLFGGLDIRFYIIPIACAPPLTITASLPSPLNTSTSSNHFASFIAKNDPWYYRHIWVGSYSLTSILPSGSTSLSISQLQELASKSLSTSALTSSSSLSSSTSIMSPAPRQRSKSRTLAGPDIDRLALSGSLVESLKAVQKQKLAASTFLTAKLVDPETSAGASGMVGNGRISSDAITKAETGQESGTDDGPREDRNRTGSGGNNNVNSNPLKSSVNINQTNSNDNIHLNNSKAVNPTKQTASTTSTATNSALPKTTVGSTTTTITTNANGTQEVIISSSITEVLVLKKKPQNTQPTPLATPASVSLTSPTTANTTGTANDPSPHPNEMNKSGNWTNNSTADGSRRNGSLGSTNPSPSRTRGNSGDSDANNGIVVGQSRSRSTTNNPPVPNAQATGGTQTLNKSSAIEKSETYITIASDTTNHHISSTSTSQHSKTIFRRSNSLSDSLQANLAHSHDDAIGKKDPLANKPSLQHSYSIAAFNYEASNANATQATSLPSNDSPSSILQAPSPARMLRQEFDTYVRDATQCLNVAVFQAECWTMVDNESLHFIVPFLIRAELGIGAYARLFAESNDLPASFTHQDIISHKMFKYIPVPLAVKSTPVNLNGVARSVQITEPRPYVSISLSNLGPLDKAQQNNANPTRPWLEFATVEAESKKRKKEESHTYYVNVVDIETEGKRLVDVLLDGEYYGGIYKLRITTCTAPLINRPPLPIGTTPTSPLNASSSLSSPPPASPSLGLSPASSPSLSSSSLLSSTSSLSSSSNLPAPTDDEQIVFPVMTYLPLDLP